MKKKQPTKKLTLPELTLRFGKDLSGKEVSRLLARGSIDLVAIEIYGRLDLETAKEKAKEENMKSLSPKDALLTIRLYQSELDRVKEIAESRGLTMSELIRGRLPELKSA